MTDVIHRPWRLGFAVCGIRRYEPGKPQPKFSTRPKDVTCPGCKRLRREKQAEAKATSREKGLIE